MYSKIIDNINNILGYNLKPISYKIFPFGDYYMITSTTEFDYKNIYNKLLDYNEILIVESYIEYSLFLYPVDYLKKLEI